MLTRRAVRINSRQARELLWRLGRSAVVWYWLLNFLRLTSGLILLPLIVGRFATADLGMHFVLMSLSALVPLVDFGFGPTIGRFVSYAMGGARSLQTYGLPLAERLDGPNFALLWELLMSARRLYRILVVVLLVILGAWGTYLVEMRIHETTSAVMVRLAWLATLAAALLDIYSNWWVVYLRGLNEVLVAARISAFAMGLRLVIAAVLLLAGCGLLSLPVGSFFGSFLQRSLARRRCLSFLAGSPTPATHEFLGTLRVLWPGTWRTGLIFVGGYLTVNANTAICLKVFGLAANAQYGLSAQLLAIITGLAGVWTSVKWPIIGQLHARYELEKVVKILRPRIWLQFVSFLAAAVGMLLFCPALLNHFGGGKNLLPLGWLSLMALGAFLDMQLALWTTLIYIGNRLPFLWPVVGSNILSPIFSLLLIHFTSLGVAALVLGPLCAGVLFNYWYWPLYACRQIGTGLLGFLFVSEPRRRAA